MQKDKSHILKGAVLGIVWVIFGLTVYLTHRLDDRFLGILPYFILVIGLAFIGILHGREKAGNVTFGNVFAYCFRALAVAVIIEIVWTALSVKIFFPGIVEQTIDIARQQMETMKGISDENIEKQLAVTRRFYLPFSIGGIILMSAIIGAIGSLIGAVLAKKNPDYRQES